MSYLLGQIFFSLAIATATGALIGWLLRSIGLARHRNELESTWRMRVARRDDILTKVANELADTKAELNRARGGVDPGERQKELARELRGTKEKLVELASLRQSENTYHEKKLQALEELNRRMNDRHENSAELITQLRREISELKQLMESEQGSTLELERLRGEAVSDRKDLEAEIERLKPLSELVKKRNEQLDQLREELESLRSRSPSGTHRTVTEEEPEFQSEPEPPPPPVRDDLKKIYGIGPVLERKLNGLGITTFRQLAVLDDDEIERVAESIDSFPDRIYRDGWIDAARQQHLQKYGEHVDT
ncbi:MAG: hypothetical protein V3U59_02300 [Gammaproteobacteria bacterium]